MLKFNLVDMNSQEQLVTHINPLNTELNPICHLLALLDAHHILHVSRIRVNPQSAITRFAAVYS